jgi:hypothetical protein
MLLDGGFAASVGTNSVPGVRIILGRSMSRIGDSAALVHKKKPAATAGFCRLEERQFLIYCVSIGV